MTGKLRIFQLFPLSALFLLLLACHTPTTTKSYIKAYENNKELNVDNVYTNEIEQKDRNLEMYLLEKGRIAQLYGRYDVSMNAFNQESDILRNREIDDDTLPGADINAGSVLVNDNLLPYRARLYEIEMLHLYQLYNYLALGNMEGALVEGRIIDYIINEAEKARENVSFDDEHYRQTEAAINKKVYDNHESISKGQTAPQNLSIKYSPSSENGTDSALEKTEDEYQSKLQKAYDRNFSKMANALAKTKSSVLNPYALYLSGIIHEANGEYDDAYICYKKALELMPENPYIQENAVRMAVTMNRCDDFKELEDIFPNAWQEYKNYKKSSDKGRLVVIYEEGWSPEKKQELISLGVVSIAYPIYKFTWIEPKALIVSSAQGQVGATYPICYMGAHALRALQEEAKWRIIRQTARAAVKTSAVVAGATAAAIGGASGNNYLEMAGILAMIFASNYNQMSESADLRSWMTLPENAQILERDMFVGEHDLSFLTQNSELKLRAKVVIFPEKTTIVWIIRENTKLSFDCLWPKGGTKGVYEVIPKYQNDTNDI